MTDIRLEIGGYPPAKNEAMSMLRAGHSHATRVRLLLEAAREQSDGQGLGSGPIGLEVTLRCPRDRSRSDATNYLGGIADVLESKGHRGKLEHLGGLAVVHLFDNDRQIEQVRYRWQDAVDPSYEVHLWSLGSQ